MTPSSRTTPQDSSTGPQSTSGKATATQTPANAHLGQDKPGLFDEQGAVGKQFTRESLFSLISAWAGGADGFNSRRSHRRNGAKDWRAAGQGGRDRQAVYDGGEHRGHGAECHGRDEQEVELRSGWVMEGVVDG